MGKINAIIEILVMGLIALLGISLNIIGFLDINKIEVLKYINEFKSYTNIILLITLAIAYQLGWIINGLTSIAYPSFLKNKAKLKYKIPSGKYSQIRDIVYFKASDNALYKIKERLSGVRLLRSSIINFLIFIVGFSSLDYLNIVFFLLIPLLIISSIITHLMYVKYVGQIINTYNELGLNKEFSEKKLLRHSTSLDNE